MKILKKKIRFLVVSLTLLVAAIICFFEFGAYFAFDKTERQKAVDVIKAAPNLPDKFVEFYNAAYPGWDDSLEVSLLTSLFESGKFGCPCKNVVTDYSYILPTDSFYEAAQLILYIERSVTPQDCLEYRLAKGDFGFATHGI